MAEIYVICPECGKEHKVAGKKIPYRKLENYSDDELFLDDITQEYYYISPEKSICKKCKKEIEKMFQDEEDPFEKEEYANDGIFEQEHLDKHFSEFIKDRKSFDSEEFYYGKEEYWCHKKTWN